MNLSQFIATAVEQIYSGVKGNKFSCYVPTDLKVNRETVRSGVFSDAEGNAVFMIDFDVAVSTSETKEGKGQGSLSVFSVVGVDGAFADKCTNANINRIRFSVPIKY